MSTETEVPPYDPAHDEPPAEHAPDTSSAAAAGRRQVHARRNTSTLLVFRLEGATR